MIEEPTGNHVSVMNHDNVIEVQLARGDHANALLPRMVQILADVLEDPPGRAVLLTGQGPHFCAGGDHEALREFDDERMRSFQDDIRRLFRSLDTCPVPIVAAAQGSSVGGGVEILLRCDFVVAADTSKFLLPQVQLDIGISQQSLRLLTAKVGARQARAMVLLGQPFSAVDSALPDFVVRQDALLGKAHEVSTILAELPPRSLSVLREQLKNLAVNQNARGESRQR